MKKKSLFTLLYAVMHTCFMYAQLITTNNTQQPQQIIEHLVGDNCASVSNITSPINGSVNNIVSYGTFNNANSNFPLQNGIVLTTGNVLNAGNTQLPIDLNDGEIDWETDPDILNILGIDQTLNATSIEFDFSTANDFVAFKYLFASDEYQQEYPCNFSDVFAIMIKPAGSADPFVNIALVPESLDFISVNTIHPDISGFCDAQNEDYFQGYNIGSTNFNGHTTVLTATSDVIPNNTYRIKFVIADHIDERFDSAVFIEAESFGGSIDLGPDQSICGNDLTLNANIDNPSADYSWFLNGNIIIGESNPTLEVNQSGTYSVEISIPVNTGSCTLTDSINIDIIPFQQAAPIGDLAICDSAPSDGVFQFDFPMLMDDEILDNLPSSNYNISYHTLLDDAQNDLNPIVDTYENTEPTEQIFVRIESLSGDCLQIGNFNISVSNSPNTVEITASVCNGQINDGGFEINFLSHFDSEISNFEFNRSVSYFLNETDAINNQNEIIETSEIVGSPNVIFARVSNNLSDCFSIERLNFDYQLQPEIDIDKFVASQCFDPDFFETSGPDIITYENATVSYNIDEIFDEIESNYPGIWIQIDALLGIIGDPRMFNTNATVFNIPLLLRFDGENCPTPLTLELHKNVLFNVFGEERIVARCDDFSNDGVYDFDLTDISNELVDGYEGISLTYYESEDDRDNQVNPINPNVPYTVNSPSEEVFITTRHNDCTFDSKVRLVIEPAPIASPQSVEACGEYNPDTNSTRILLNPYINTMVQGLGNVSVSFYATEQDAENNENAIESINVVGNFQQVYSRITNNATSCYSITTLDINIFESLDINSLSPIVICDADQDGFSIVNLLSVIPELSIDINEFDISFYETLDNALGERNEISNPEAYNSESQSIFIRIQRINLECFAIVDFEIAIFDNPIINGISDFINCTNATNTADFYFENKDSEIINGQENMQVFYFETENDAINKENEIDKTIAYQNTNNPQTIFVRLENELENSCFEISSLQIEVREAPIYNVPTDVFECDINNNGLASTDLNLKVNEIAEGSPSNLNISFHLTPLNAELGTNALAMDFTPTSNPQIIYSRVENLDSGCTSIDTFLVNTLALPEVNYGQSLTSCANNYQFEQLWDLTEIELLVLDGRQFGIEFSYFESEDDLFANQNVINNVESFTNTLGQNTLFIKIQNT